MITSSSTSNSLKKDFFESIRQSVDKNLDKNWDLLKSSWSEVEIEFSHQDTTINSVNIRSNIVDSILSFKALLKNRSFSFEEFSTLLITERQKIFSGDDFSARFLKVFGLSRNEDSIEFENCYTISSLQEILQRIKNNENFIKESDAKEIATCFGIDSMYHVFITNSMNQFVSNNSISDLKENLLDLLIFLRKSYADYLKIPIYFDDFNEVLTWKKSRLESETGNIVPNLFLNHIVFSPLNSSLSTSIEKLEDGLKEAIFNRVSETYKQYIISSQTREFSFANFSSGKKKLSMFDDDSIKEKLKKVLVSQFLGMGMSVSDKERLAELIKETLLEK